MGLCSYCGEQVDRLEVHEYLHNVLDQVSTPELFNGEYITIELRPSSVKSQRNKFIYNCDHSSVSLSPIVSKHVCNAYT